MNVFDICIIAQHYFAYCMSRTSWEINHSYCHHYHSIFSLLYQGLQTFSMHILAPDAKLLNHFRLPHCCDSLCVCPAINGWSSFLPFKCIVCFWRTSLRSGQRRGKMFNNSRTNFRPIASTATCVISEHHHFDPWACTELVSSETVDGVDFLGRRKAKV